MSVMTDTAGSIRAASDRGLRIGCSGTRSRDPGDEPVLAAILAQMMAASPAEVTTGACHGFDHHIGKAAYHGLPAAHHRVIVPADRSRIAVWWEGLDVEVIEMPPGSSYRDRNARILDFTDRLYACPRLPEQHPEARRSGTWMTVRMARQRGIGVREWVLP